MFVCIDLPDASQTSGTSGQETVEGSDRPGAAGRLRGVRSVPRHEHQPGLQELHEQEVPLSAGRWVLLQIDSGGVKQLRVFPLGQI